MTTNPKLDHSPAGGLEVLIWPKSRIPKVFILLGGAVGQQRLPFLHQVLTPSALVERRTWSAIRKIQPRLPTSKQDCVGSQWLTILHPSTLLSTIEVIRYIRVSDILWYCDHGWTHKSNWIKIYGQKCQKYMPVLCQEYMLFFCLPLSSQPRLNLLSPQQQGRPPTPRPCCCIFLTGIYFWHVFN